MRITVERKPPAPVLRISAIFLETERAVGARENIDRVVACGVFERRQNFDGRGHCDRLWSFGFLYHTCLPLGSAPVTPLAEAQDRGEKMRIPRFVFPTLALGA